MLTDRKPLREAVQMECLMVQLLFGTTKVLKSLKVSIKMINAMVPGWNLMQKETKNAILSINLILKNTIMAQYLLKEHIKMRNKTVSGNGITITVKNNRKKNTMP